VTIAHTDHTDHTGDAGPDNPDSPADQDIHRLGEVAQDDPAARPGEVPPAAADAGPELLLVDPRMLVVGVNTRADVALDKAFVGSIADRGCGSRSSSAATPTA
jgi:hypothetical protein